MQTVQLLELRFWACCDARRIRIETIMGDGKRALVSEDQPASHLWPLVVAPREPGSFILLTIQCPWFSGDGQRYLTRSLVGARSSRFHLLLLTMTSVRKGGKLGELVEPFCSENLVAVS